MHAESDTRLRVLVSAFAGDPLSQWLVPEPQHRRPVYRQWFAAALAHADEAGEVRAGDCSTQVWLPGTAADPPRMLDEQARARVRQLPGLDVARFDLFGELVGQRHPRAAHSYLALIGVEPARQGAGIGTAVLADALRVHDEAGVPTYLEASSARSRRLYRRLGYRDLGDPIELPGGPTLHPMWRAVGGGR